MFVPLICATAYTAITKYGLDAPLAAGGVGVVELPDDVATIGVPGSLDPSGPLTRRVRMKRRVLEPVVIVVETLPLSWIEKM